MRIEQTILRHLVHKENFARKALPFLRDEYFSDSSERLIYHRINEFVQKYNDIPSREALEIDLEQIKNLSEDQYEQSITLSWTASVSSMAKTKIELKVAFQKY
jgi:Lon protease-like protein